MTQIELGYFAKDFRYIVSLLAPIKIRALAITSSNVIIIMSITIYSICICHISNVTTVCITYVTYCVHNAFKMFYVCQFLSVCVCLLCVLLIDSICQLINRQSNNVLFAMFWADSLFQLITCYLDNIFLFVATDRD